MEFNRIRSARWHRVFGRPNRVRLLTAAFGVAATVGIFAAAFSEARALQAPSGGKQGLRGIWPKEVPADLNADSFSVLNGAWDKWGKDVAGLVAKLYTDDKLDSAGQRELLTQLEGKIKTMDKALADPRFASLGDAIASVRERLARRVDVALAMLDTLELNPEEVKTAAVAREKKHALRHLDQLVSYLGTISGGNAWLTYVKVDDLRTALNASGTPGAVVATVDDKLHSSTSAENPAQREFLSRPEFRHLAQALSALRHAAEMKTTEGDQQALRTDLTNLETALEAYEESGASEDSHKVIDALAAAEKVAIDEGDRLDKGVRPHYMNYNLTAVTSDAMLTKLLGETSQTTGPVTDYILGANVSGTEWTTTTVSVRIQPSDHGAVINLILDGTVQSSTVGVTSQANIYTSGYHRFGAMKPINFDGTNITTGPAQMLYVQPSNTTTGASTQFSGFPLFGRIADSIAVNEAEKRRGESEAIAADRVQSRVLPEVDSRVDKLIQDANSRLHSQLQRRLKEAGIYPVAVRARSNQTFLRLSAEIADKQELAGDMAPSIGYENAGLVLQLHETLLTNSAHRMKFAGQSLTDAQVKTELERFLSLLVGRKVEIGKSMAKSAPVPLKPVPPAPGSAPAPAPAPAAAPESTGDNSLLVFDSNDPIRFTIENGEVSLILRAGIKQEGKEDIPTQSITVPLRLSVKGNQVLVDRGTVQVAPATANADRATQVVRAGVMRKKLESVITPMALDGTIHVPREGRADVDLAISDVKAFGGWLTIMAN
ncbi:MAG TPA: hypothetical protein VGP63_17720 [Planctomycetaceae bacterium]|jgi:hypothetical protein|nr:hypothetical protein [Planctomycetaceae bacterium]